MSSGAAELMAALRRSSSSRETSLSPNSESNNCSLELPKKRLSTCLTSVRLASCDHAGGARLTEPALLAVVDVAFLFEDTDGGQDGVVGQCFTVGHGRNQVVHCRFAAAPEDLHEPEFGFG